MAERAHTGLVVCVKLCVIKGCHSAGSTEVKFVPLTLGIFQEAFYSDLCELWGMFQQDSESVLLTGHS